MRPRVLGVPGRAWLAAFAASVTLVSGGCTRPLFPDTLPPSVGLSNDSTDAAVVGKPVGFVVTAATPVNVANVFITSVHMDFGDGLVADLAGLDVSSGVVKGNVSHPYSAPGFYTATVTVTDTSRNEGKASLRVYVNDLPKPAAPTVGLTTSTSPVLAGSPVSFTVTSSIPGSPTNNFIQRVHLDFGDGFSVDLGGASTSTVIHTYSTAGSYLVTALAIDTNGTVVQASMLLAVTNPAKPAPPSVGFTSTVVNPTPVGAVVTFTVTVTFPGNPANVFIRSIHVDFGDGQSAELGAQPGSVSHAYGSPGTYTAVATVTDTSGNDARASLTVIVK
jgi:PKD repeat protein